jgi:O-antigen ligase
VATIYLTSSRGGAATAAFGTLVFLALTERRLAAIGYAACAIAGSAAAIAVLLPRSELVDGPLQSAAASDQGSSAALLIFLVCVATGAVGALASRIPLPAIRLTSRGRAIVAATLIVAAIGGIVAADPVDRYNTFKKSPTEFEQVEVDYTRAHLLSGSGSGRWQFWQASVDEFETRPLVGRGAGSYESWWAQHGSLFRFVRDAHSLWLETLGELGLVGLFLLVAAFGVALAVGVSRLRAARGPDRVTIAALIALVAAWCLAAGIDWMWELTVVTVVAIACLGLLTGPATAGSVPLAKPGAMRLSLRGQPLRVPSASSLARAGVAILALLVIAAEAIPLRAQTKIRDSQAAVARGDAQSAIDDAESAHDLQPWAATPHLQLALVREQIGDLRAAQTEIAAAIDDDRTDWRLWLVQARLETKSGEIDRARVSLRRAKQLNPRSPLFAAQ